MSRRACYSLLAIAAAPVLLLTLLASAFQPAWTVLLWIAAVAGAAEFIWRRQIRPISVLSRFLGVPTVAQATNRVQDLQAEARCCREEKADLEHLLDDISTGLGEGLMVVDADLHVRLINPRARQCLGAENVPIGSSFLEFERDPEVVRAIRESVGGQPSKRILIENPRGVWEIRPFPLSQTGTVVLFTEIGPLRRAAELRRRFVQDLSHELRSPLAVMRTTIEALEGEVSPDIGQMLVRQVERITRLTDELYELASIEAGTLSMEPRTQGIQPLIRQISSDFASISARAQVDLRTSVPENFQFTFDRRALTRVISNLVDNAIKYNRPGGWVRISAAEIDDAVRIEVEDSGLGIPAAELGSVLQRFYRVDRARTPGAGGLGLGLAIVKHMVQLMGGDLGLDSREDIGTRVTLVLPQAPPESASGPDRES